MDDQNSKSAEKEDSGQLTVSTIARAIVEGHNNPPIAVPEIIRWLLSQAEQGELSVSFEYPLDPDSDYENWFQYFVADKKMNPEQTGDTILVSIKEMQKFCHGIVYQVWAGKRGFAVPELFQRQVDAKLNPTHKPVKKNYGPTRQAKALLQEHYDLVEKFKGLLECSYKRAANEAAKDSTYKAKYIERNHRRHRESLRQSGKK